MMGKYERLTVARIFTEHFLSQAHSTRPMPRASRFLPHVNTNNFKIGTYTDT